MATLDLSFSAVNIPTNTSANAIIYEDVGNNGGANSDSHAGTTVSYDNKDTIALSDGVTSYTSADVFDESSGNSYQLVVEPDNTDVVSAADITEGATLTVETGPSAPTNLSVSQGAEDQLDLSWDDVSNEDGYRVYRDTSSGVTTSDTQVADLAAGTTTYTDTGLLDGEKYFYVVTAYNTGGESNPSNEDSAVTVLPNPTSLSIDAINGDQFDLSFDDHADHKNGYRVYVGDDGYLNLTGSGEANGPSRSYSWADDGFSMAMKVDPELVSGEFEGLFAHDPFQRIVTRAEDTNEFMIDIVFSDGTGSGEFQPFTFDGTPTTVVVSWDPSLSSDNLKVWENGTLAGTLTTGSGKTLAPSTESLQVAFRGTDDVDFYWFEWGDTPVTQSEVDNLSQSGLPGARLQYFFNEGSGSTVTDYISGDDLALTSPYTWHQGGALSQDGTDIAAEYALNTTGTISSPTGPTGMGTDAITIAVTFTTPGFYDWQALCKFNWSSAGAFNLNANQGSSSSDGNLSWAATDSSGNITNIAGDSGLNTNTTYTVVATCDFAAGSGSLWRDGTQVGSASGLSLATLTPSDSSIEHQTNGNELTVDELSCWPSVLTDSEIANVFDPHVADPTGKFIEWNLDDRSTPSTAQDTSGNGNDGSISSGSYVPPLTSITYTTTNLEDGEKYVLRASVFTEHTEVYDN